MQVQLRIRRFNPEKDSVPWWGDYTVQDVRPNDSVLDVLHRVKWEQDGTLSLRRSCAHGVCGSDAVRINGANALACKTLVARLAKEGSNEAKIQIEPILGMRVLKDLIVDEIKIDRSFISGLGESGRSTTIVSAIIGMAKSFNINVIAEGVETEEQLDILKTMHCSEVQGYLLGRPMSIGDLKKHFKT